MVRFVKLWVVQEYFFHYHHLRNSDNNLKSKHVQQLELSYFLNLKNLLLK